MRKKFLLIITLGLCLLNIGTVNANDKVDRPPLEKDFFEAGYKSVEEALDECEAHFNKKIKLPYKLPPVSFTHYIGSCDKDKGINNDFEVEYMNENSPENHYTITLKPKQHSIKFKPEHVETIKLNKGKAFYVTKPIGANVLVFERDGWQYIIGIDKRVSEQVPLESLVDIANSFK
jgi:hypothetical protein